MNKHLLTIITAFASLTFAQAQAPANVQAVDLGLSVYWASCNIGATTPEDYGDYFAWGETKPKTDYSWATYKYAKGAYNKLTKYCTNAGYGDNGFTDDKTTLDPEDDAAHTNWGEEWHIPTDAEWKELRTQCTWMWTTQNGVNGSLVTSKTNSNSVFLPAAGFRDGTDLKGVGSYGDYWYSSLYGYPGSAWSLELLSDGIERSGYSRNYGFSVRPVQESGTGTGFGYTAATNTAPARKLLRNGQIFIEKGGKTYTLMGVEVK